MITLSKDDDSNIESCCVTSDTRHPRVCLRKIKTHDVEKALLSPFVPFGLVLAFQAWLWPFGSDTLYNLTICEIDVICVQLWNFQQFFEHGLQESLQKLSDFIVRGEVPCQIS